MRQLNHRWYGHFTHLWNMPRPNAWAASGGCALLMTVIPLCSGPAIAADRPGLEYNRDVRPILAENCFACHGPDSAARKADLRLDRRDEAIKAGAITPGDTESSELLARTNAKDPKELMPPPATTKKLTQEQKDVLQRWIADGAAYQPHWSLIAPKRPDLPAVHDSAWAREPDRPLRAGEARGERTTTCPRSGPQDSGSPAGLDLTGLPPEPEVVEAFVHDRKPDAYETLVTRFLDSPRWGEHRARYWLDSARYADTNGYHFDNFREAWAFRDWVIGAFNRNLTFDRFTIEQLAGDLLPGSTLDQQVASGFNRCNATTNEGGVIPEEYQVLYTRDRTETVSQVWMGLTAGCAVCHDHKFDPISQREFYELSAFFNNTTQADHGRQRQGYAPDRLRPQCGRSTALADALGGTGGRPEPLGGSQAVRPGRLHEMARRSRSQGARGRRSRPVACSSRRSVRRSARRPSPAQLSNRPTRVTSRKTMRSRSGPGSRCPSQGCSAR